MSRAAVENALVILNQNPHLHLYLYSIDSDKVITRVGEKEMSIEKLPLREAGR
jgi:hypothetical protein